MMDVRPAEPAPGQRRLVDDAVLAYVEWREECAIVWESYGRWERTTAEEAICAQAAYRAALDREEAAATAYAHRLERLVDVLTQEPMTAQSN